ncbi:MAG: hypothetical protein IT566_00550 [Rhodospirillaceae bacterium]|nr:hypothetical protein [Rhodospirillaceae bacterium]
MSLAVLLIGLALNGPALAQDLCGNIRLSVSEQIECRGRLTNALGDGDRTRIQQEFEDRIRRANDRLITPPVLRSPPPPVRPVAPVPPDAPVLPGSTPNPAPALPTPPGDVAPRAAPPSGSTAVAPDLTAPDPAASPLPPISPIPPSPTGSPAVLK